MSDFVEVGTVTVSSGDGSVAAPLFVRAAESAGAAEFPVSLAASSPSPVLSFAEKEDETYRASLISQGIDPDSAASLDGLPSVPESDELLREIVAHGKECERQLRELGYDHEGFAVDEAHVFGVGRC